MHESNTALGIFLIVVVIFCGGMLYSGAHKNNVRQQNAKTRIEQQIGILRSQHMGQQLACDRRFTETWNDTQYGIVGKHCFMSENNHLVNFVCTPTECWVRAR